MRLSNIVGGCEITNDDGVTWQFLTDDMIRDSVIRPEKSVEGYEEKNDFI